MYVLSNTNLYILSLYKYELVLIYTNIFLNIRDIIPTELDLSNRIGANVSHKKYERQKYKH